MRKLLLSGGLASLLLAGLAGCLKDDEFEDQQYGLQVPDVPSVSFPQKLQSPFTIGIVQQATSQEVTGPLLALNQKSPVGSPVNVTLEIDDALVTAEGLELMPAGSYSVNSLNVTIPAGAETSDAVKITIPDATILDNTKLYGIGFKIKSVDPGYTVAKNLSTMIISFSIKNKFDGIYLLNMELSGWGAYGIQDGPPAYDYGTEFELITVNAYAVSLFNIDRGDNLQPGFTTGGGPTAFGATTPLYTFDANDKLIEVKNTSPDDGRGRALQIAPLAGSNYFDPATKTIYMNYIMKQNGRPDQKITLIWTYVRPR